MSTNKPIQKQRITSSATQAAQADSASNNAKTLYVIFGIVVVGLLFLIIWFGYILWKPDGEEIVTEETPTAVTNSVNTNKSNTNSNKNSNPSLLDDEDENTNTNSNDEAESDENDKNTNEDEADGEADGLVEPDDEEDDATATTSTLYFATSSSACGETVAVERDLELGEDPYGEIVLSMMAGPESEEDGVDGIPGTVRLRQVQYTAAGPLITVNEEYDELDSCAKKTVDAQFIETANAMFDLPAGTSGTVEVGTVAVEEDTTDTNTNSAE